MKVVKWGGSADIALNIKCVLIHEKCSFLILIVIIIDSKVNVPVLILEKYIDI